MRAPRICGCGLTIASGEPCPCQRQREAARKARLDARRPSASERGYDAAWRACRSRFLARHPQCCAPGCIEAATEVDHILSVADRPDLRLSWSNLRGFCKAHHSARTACDQGFAKRAPAATPLPARAERAPAAAPVASSHAPGGGGRGSKVMIGTARGSIARIFPETTIRKSDGWWGID
jgi:5-methylcytosine-specific restriction protein A